MEKSGQIDHKGCFSLLVTPNFLMCQNPESLVLNWPPPKITESRTWVSLGAANSDSAMFWGVARYGLCYLISLLVTV